MIIELLLVAISGLLVFIFIAVVASGGTIRRRIAVVGKDNRIRSEWVHPKHIDTKNGHPWYAFRKMDYDFSGPWYEFEYRLVRSFGARKYIGVQRIYLEGNPVPFAFKESDQLKALQGTAKALYDEGETDLPNRLLRPRRVDIILIVLVGLMAFAVGLALGGQL